MSSDERPAGRGPADRERLAAALREARVAAGLTGVEAGRAAGFGQSKVSKIERAALLPSPADVEALCRAYGVTARAQCGLVRLAEGLREEQSAKVILARGVGQMQRRLRRLKESTTTIRGFQPATVSGLLQTVAYARCVFEQPDSQQLPEDQVEEGVGERLAGQAVLDDPSKDVRVILTEGALRWQAGSAALMEAQVEAIAAALDRTALTFGIIPWTRPVRFFPRHGFYIYDEDAVMVGTETATATMTGAADVATYLELFMALEEVAAYGDEAREHLARIAGDYRRLAGS